jgi:hypothetical protein
MNDLIQSLPSPSPIAGITHTWMGEAWMVDGETSVMMMVMISQIPVPTGCQHEVSGSKSRFLMVAAQRNSMWEKRQKPQIFSGQRVYVGGRGTRGNGWGGHTTPWRGLTWPVPPSGVVPSWPISVSYSGSVCLLIKYDFCNIFRDFL